MKQRVYTKSTDFQPIGDNVLVKAVELKTEETTETGVIIGTNQHASVVERPTMGVIIASGDESDHKEGETLFWPNTDGLDFEFNDGDFVLLQNKSIVGKLR